MGGLLFFAIFGFLGVWSCLFTFGPVCSLLLLFAPFCSLLLPFVHFGSPLNFFDITLQKIFRTMTKTIGIRVDENVSNCFDSIHSELGNSTKGETFAQILEKYELAALTVVNTDELTEELARVNALLAEKNTMLARVNTELADVKTELTHHDDLFIAKQNAIEDLGRQLSEKQVENNVLTEKIQMLTEEKQALTETRPAARPVSEKWSAIAQAYADLNEMADGHDVVWHVFGSYTENNLDPGLKRPSRDTIEEIKMRFTN